MASQCWAVSTKFFQWCTSVGENCQSLNQWHSSLGKFQLIFFQWCSSVPCKYSLGGPVVFQCTLGQPVAFQWHSSVHWTSQCTLAQGKGNCLMIGQRTICGDVKIASREIIIPPKYQPHHQYILMEWSPVSTSVRPFALWDAGQQGLQLHKVPGPPGKFRALKIPVKRD